ncbi:MAG: hypothetical protein GY719_21770, partial [bacterium]|nr:hypothetical protein [bacterium]
PGRGEAGDPRRSADDGAHRHHGSIATNMLIPEVLELPHWEEQVRLTREWIRGETVIPEIADLWPAGPVASLDLLGPDEVRAGDELVLRAVVSNRKVGHNFTTGPLDFMRAWVHLVVADADGTTLAEWGNLDPETRSISDVPGQLHRPGNSRQEGTLVLEGMPLDAEGNVLARHELWRKAGGVGQRIIFPRYSDNQVYRFDVPPSARGPLTVHAELGFRRYRQEFLDLVVPTMEQERGILQPTVIQASASKTIEVVERVAMNRPRDTGRRKGT